MKYRVWITMLLIACLLTGCVPAPVESSAETHASSEPETSAPATAGSTVPGGNCDIAPIPSVPKEKHLESRSETVWVNWMSEDELLQAASLNPEEGEPLFRIDSLQELNAFYEKWAPSFSFDWGLDETRSFDENITAYDESFFEANSLLIAYIEEGSGTYRFGLNRIYVKAGSCLYMEVKYLNDPEIGDCMMAGWFTVAEVSKTDLEDVTEYHCLRVGLTYRGDDAYMTEQAGVYEFTARDSALLYENALNVAPIETMRRNDLHPLYRLDSVAELTDFCRTYAEDAQALGDSLSSYDGDFFAEKSLIVISVETWAGPYHYHPGELTITPEGDLMADIHWAGGQVGIEEEGSWWLVVYAVEKSELENVRLYKSAIHSDGHLDW